MDGIAPQAPASITQSLQNKVGEWWPWGLKISSVFLHQQEVSGEVSWWGVVLTASPCSSFMGAKWLTLGPGKTGAGRGRASSVWGVKGMGPGNPISSWSHSVLHSKSITANEPGDRIKYPLIAVPREGLCQLSLPHAQPSRWEIRYPRVTSDGPEDSLGPGHPGWVEGGTEGRLGCCNGSEKQNIYYHLPLSIYVVRSALLCASCFFVLRIHQDRIWAAAPSPPALCNSLLEMEFCLRKPDILTGMWKSTCPAPVSGPVCSSLNPQRQGFLIIPSRLLGREAL